MFGVSSWYPNIELKEYPSKWLLLHNLLFFFFGLLIKF